MEVKNYVETSDQQRLRLLVEYHVSRMINYIPALNIINCHSIVHTVQGSLVVVALNKHETH